MMKLTADDIDEVLWLIDLIDRYKDALDRDMQRLRADYRQAENDILSCKVALNDVEGLIMERALQMTGKTPMVTLLPRKQED